MSTDKELRVLLVEDDQAYADLVKVYLSDSNIDVYWVSCLGDALRALGSQEDKEFAGVMLDLNLPDSQGLMTFVRLHDMVPKLPIVVMTASDNDELAVELLANGAQEYLVKAPGHLELVHRTIRTAIERKKLSERLRLLESFVTNSNDAIVITEAGVEGTRRKILFVNEAFSRMTGYDPQEVIGMPLRILDGPQTNTEQLAFMESSLAKAELFRGELLNYRKDGTTFWVDVQMVPVTDDSGLLTHWVSVRREISEQKKAEESTRRLSLMEQRQEFVTMLTHDLKIPVVGASRVLQLIIEGEFGALSPGLREIMTKMKTSNESLLKMIHNMLELYSYEDSKDSLQLAPLNMVSLLEECVTEMSNLAQGKNVRIKAQIAKRPILIEADGIAVRRLVCNVLDNAIKYSPVGGIIDVSLEDHESSCTVSIRDQGPGIPDNVQPTLFNSVWRGEPGKSYAPYTGLGLYLSKKIVDAHGGTISCQSTGHGTQVVFALPKLNNVRPDADNVFNTTSDGMRKA